MLNQGLAEATPERIAALSRACRAGNGEYNGACHELLLLCNAGVREACRARSTCDDSVLDALQQEKGRVCNVYGGRNCPAGNHMLFPLYNKEVLCRNAGERIRLNSECVNARMRIVNECYQGIPDEVHTGEIVRAMGVEEDCWNIFIRNNCADMYLPQQ